MGAPGRRVTWILSVAAALALGAALTTIVRPRPEPQPPALLTLQDMGHLVSVRVNVADIVEFTESRTFDIPWSSWELKYAGTRVLLIAKGDCVVGTDLRAGRYESVDSAGRTATLVLPAPAVMQARLNHAPAEQGGSRLYSVSNQGIEALIPGTANRIRAIEGAMRIAQAKVEEAGRSPDVIQAARRNAETLLKGTLAALGWTVIVAWDDDRGAAR